MDIDIDELEQIANGHRQAGDFLGCAKTFELIANFFEMLNDKEKSRFYRSKILENLKKSAEKVSGKDFVEAVERWCGAACLAKRLNKEDYEKCIEQMDNIVERAALKSIEKGDYLEAADIYKQAGVYIKEELDDENFKEFYRKAIDCFKKNLEFVDKDVQSGEKIKKYFKIAQLYDDIAEYNEAIHHHDEAIKMFESDKQSNSYHVLAKIYQHKASCLKKLNTKNEDPIDLFKKAIEFFNLEADENLKSKNYLKAAENLSLASGICDNLGVSSKTFFKELVEKEADCYECYAKNLESSGEIKQSAFLERDAAYCYYKLKFNERAVDLLLKSAKKLEEEKENLRASQNYIDVSILYESLGDYKHCAEYAFKSARIAKLEDCNYTAVENFIRAFNCFNRIHEAILINSCKSEILDCLSKLSDEEKQNDNHHLSGTFLFEAYIFAPDDKKGIFLEKSFQSYLKATETAMSESNPPIAAYSLCCAGLVSILLHQEEKFDTILEKYNTLASERYILLVKDFIDVLANNEIDEQYLNNIKEKYKKLIENSKEIQNFLAIIGGDN
jgi:tetratricopeptide (TPR) repeat protein